MSYLPELTPPPVNGDAKELAVPLDCQAGLVEPPNALLTELNLSLAPPVDLSVNLSKMCITPFAMRNHISNGIHSTAITMTITTTAPALLPPAIGFVIVKIDKPRIRVSRHIFKVYSR